MERVARLGEELRLRLYSHRQPPDVDEALRCRLVVLVALVVRRQAEGVEAARRLRAHRRRLALVQPHPHRAGHVALRRLDVTRQVLVVGGEPEAVVYQVGILLR